MKYLKFDCQNTLLCRNLVNCVNNIAQINNDCGSHLNQAKKVDNERSKLGLLLKINSHKILPIGENDAAKLSLGQQLQFFTRFLLSIKEMGGVSHTKRQLKYKI